MNLLRMIVIAGVITLSANSCRPQGKEPSPTDLEWLKTDCQDGALVHHADGRIYLTELSRGESVYVGPGSQPEFSPDSARFTWIDGTRVLYRKRKGDETIHEVATQVEPSAGVHWLNDDELLCVQRENGKRRWFRIALDGTSRTEVKELTALGTGGYECDVRRGQDGVWSYVAKRSWRTSDGRSGVLPGTCSVSLTLDGRSATSLHNPHKRCSLTAIRHGGLEDELIWKFSGSFDNHRWASNDRRYLIFVDESCQTMVVMNYKTGKCTRMGTLGRAEHGMYGDFTVGSGRVKQSDSPTNKTSPAPKWPVTQEGLVFVWNTVRHSNSIVGDDSKRMLCQFRPEGHARYSSNFALQFPQSGGVFRCEATMCRRVQTCWERSGQLTLELTLTPQSASTGNTGPLFQVGNRSDPFLQLTQTDGGLVLHHRPTSENTSKRSLGKLKANSSVHFVALLSDRLVKVYLDGQLVQSMPLDSNRTIRKLDELTLGGNEPGARWQGEIRSIAIYDRLLDQEEISQKADAMNSIVAKQRKSDPITARATLERKIDFPDGELYPNSLVVYQYQVAEEFVSVLGQRQIWVVHWGLVNGKVIEKVRDRRVGEQYSLTLKPFEEQRQLELVKLVRDPRDIGRPLQFDVIH